jgi:2-polyprenyl-3-methyl-5-hydroxy-6-metoxy-1,4-benzoquinol methylase
MKISKGLEEEGVVVGNTYDKYGSRNPVVHKIMSGFSKSLSELVIKASPNTIHDVGCGEGFWVLEWIRQGKTARGTDFSSQVIELARSNAIKQGASPTLFEPRSIYDLNAPRDSADLVVCCEVLEHLDHPEDALSTLQTVIEKYLIVSVPREPVWRALNLARGKYIGRLGNTPGHIQHWSRDSFMQLISKYFQIVEVENPLPWTMLLCQPRP